MADIRIIHGDCLEELKKLPDNSVDSCVTDPPYELGFMGKGWDKTGIANNADMWREVLRVLKPGGHLLSFGGTRTYHRMACAIEDAGFEVRDMGEWIYSTGFPKSSRINLSPTFCQCAETARNGGNKGHEQGRDDHNDTVGTSDDGARSLQGAPHSLRGAQGSLADYQQGRDSGDAQPPAEQSSDQEISPSPGYAQGRTRSAGRGDAPASESSDTLSSAQYKTRRASKGSPPQVAASAVQDDTPSSRKLPADTLGTGDHTPDSSDSSSYENYTTAFPQCKKCGKPNADGYGSALKPAHEPFCIARKPLSESTLAANVLRWGVGALNIDGCRVGTEGGGQNGSAERKDRTQWRMSAIKKSEVPMGRWPANLIHDGSDEVVGMFPNSKSTGGSGPASKNWKGDGHTVGAGLSGGTGGFGDNGSAARFFYCAKASKKDRDEGLEGLEEKEGGKNQTSLEGGPILTGSGNERSNLRRNNHPTVKPTELMRYLCRLVTPPGGTVLDPFLGSGSTLKAAKLEGFNGIGIEREEEYVRIAEARIAAVEEQVRPATLEL